MVIGTRGVHRECKLKKIFTWRWLSRLAPSVVFVSFGARQADSELDRVMGEVMAVLEIRIVSGFRAETFIGTGHCYDPHVYA